MKEIAIAIGALILIVLLFLPGYAAYRNSLEHGCQEAYGKDHVLWSSPSNSSVSMCKSPDGTLKELK